MSIVESIIQWTETVVLLVVVLSPLIIVAVAIVIFARRDQKQTNMARAPAFNIHLMILVGVGLLAGAIGYQWGILYFCSAHPEPRYSCNFAAKLFAAPAAFAIGASSYLVLYLLVRRLQARKKSGSD
jgi:hypothetical protein